MTLAEKKLACFLICASPPADCFSRLNQEKNELYLYAKYGNMEAIEERQRRFRHEEQNIILQ